MKNSLLLILLLVAGSQLHAADYYWVNGGGNWSDLNHWRLGSSSGAIPSIVPSSGDNVFFDAGSGFGTTAPAKTVTLDANGFCNNMTWSAVPNSPTFITANVAFTVQISGNASLSPTTTYQAVMAFKGSTAATLTTNGTVLGQFGMEVDKPGSSLTVTDSLIVPSAVTTAGTNGFTFTSGTLDITGKKMKVYSFSGDSSKVRALEMVNATLTVNSVIGSAYNYTGSGKTLNAAGSTLLAGAFTTDGGTYNKVTATTAAGPNTIIINNTTFSSLTFSPVSGGIYSDIGYGNTVDTLVYNGQGSIGSNNTIGSVRFAGVGTIDGTGNVIRSITCLNTFAVSGNYTNTVDSLMLAPNHTTTFKGTFNINKYLYVAGAPCDAYTEINGDSTAGTVNFITGAIVDISNVLLTGVKATGPITPIAVSGIDGGGNAGFTITEPTGTGTTYYWVGGSGDWNNKNHWSLSSGGAGGVCVPFKSDNVVFDANSGLAGGTVTTSSSSFCNDMTWVSGVGTVTFATGATSFRVYGSVVLQPTVTLNAVFSFSGSSAATLTTNGGGTGGVQFWIYKTGSGSVTLLDNWSNPSSGIIGFASGSLSMAGRTVSLYIFTSNYTTTRSLDISNATITTGLRWIYQGSNKTITSTSSHITSANVFQVNNPGSNYPWVDLSSTGAVYNIIGTTIGQLTFTATAATSAASIANGNTIRRLEFKGAGAVTGGSNNIDSLILAGSRNYTFAGTNTINQYFKAQATPCTGLTEIRGNTTGTLAFGSAATVQIANVYLQNMTATGVITPIAFNGADAGGNTGWTINSAAGSARYWIGGSGDWNDPNHWSATSGGAAGACVPTVYDDVYFDAASGFTAVSKTVTVSNGNAYCRNLNWANATNAPVWNKSTLWNMEVWGDSIILNPAATFTALITPKGPTPAFMKGNVLGDFDFNIDKLGSSLTILNDYNNAQTNIGLLNGALNASGIKLSILQVDNSAALNNVFAVNISNSTVTAPFGWRFQGTIANHTLNAANSSITTSDFKANGLSYDTVNATGTITASVAMNSTTINRLSFTDPGTASAVGIVGAGNTLGRVEFKGGGVITGTGNVIDTLIFFPGSNYTLTAGTNTTITGDWYGSGTPCHLTQIYSSSTTANATVTKTSGDANFDYVRLRRITAAGSAAPFIAREHTDNQGNNTNWTIAPYNGVAPIYGLGPDTTVPALPYTIHTNGFFGSPASQYLWNNGSTGDSLIAADTGIYSVNVSFVDGCNISDQVRIKLPNPLGLTLMDFNAQVQDCQAHLNWQVANVKGFSHFGVERSTDGRNFTTIAELPYTDVADYAYTDAAPENGASYYRLKLADIDTRYSYSKTVSTNIDCRPGVVKVYPTVTSGRVRIVLPQGYSGSKIQLYNIFGQSLNRPAGGSGAFRTMDLEDLPNGTYLLRVINGNDILSFKIQKQ